MGGSLMQSLTPHRRSLLGFLVVIVVLNGFWFFGFLNKSAEPEALQVLPVDRTGVPVQDPWKLSPAENLNFPYPTLTARENLRNDTFYVTGFALAGFTNQFIAFMNLIYLGLQSERIPVIPPFTPSHMSDNAGALRFGTVMNMTSLSKVLRRPILEWSDVKDYPANGSVILTHKPTDPAVEHIGCWSLRQRSLKIPVWVPMSENVLKIDLSFTRVPGFAFFEEKEESELQLKFPALASLIVPKHPHPASKNQPLMAPSKMGSKLPPDEHMACFDFMYYISTGVKKYEFENRWSLAWNSVGMHIKFTDEMLALAKEYLARSLYGNRAAGQTDIPPIITVHIRRGDFKTHCANGQKAPCYPPLSKYRQVIEKVQAEVLETLNINATRVIVASDESDPKFWEEVTSFGWNYLDHTVERTMERYGEWYPVLIDKVALSIGIGFVGTEGSTFSILNARRVEDWNGGATDMVSFVR
ncbi:hypothetical protein DFP72DRAFT_1009754 [Ephemerocybe angulata]|uniref:O-fucosyltransferase family protein n=1 Tax=Ephemerocybe angulata TaxID=980116 RepID=A0A8H6HVU9_9AGAR|nr:hypothetical protein DFP72DRAFT_1009754 [Tulosesus angulatus]